MTHRTQPWTHWALGAYLLALIAASGVCWALGVPSPAGWLGVLLLAPVVALAWLDAVKRGDADVDRQDRALRDEVRRAVDAEFDRRGGVEVVFETTEDVVVPAGVGVTVPAKRRGE